MNSLGVGIVLLLIAFLVLLMGLGSRGLLGNGMHNGGGYGMGGFLLADLNFVVFALGVICGSLVLANVMTGYQGGIVLLVIGILVFLVWIAGRGFFMGNNAVGNRGIV